jgi:hypothetical protein
MKRPSLIDESDLLDIHKVQFSAMQSTFRIDPNINAMPTVILWPSWTTLFVSKKYDWTNEDSRNAVMYSFGAAAVPPIFAVSIAHMNDDGRGVYIETVSLDRQSLVSSHELSGNELASSDPIRSFFMEWEEKATFWHFFGGHLDALNA